MDVGYHASHEQHSPRDLLTYAQLSERAGFRQVMCSDHLMPLSERQGHSAFAWSWLGAAMQATALPFGTVTTPGFRYHPAVLAQAAATLADMWPGRFWLALGSGELVNEHVVDGRWPPKETRQEIVEETADVMRRLFRGETVSRDGPVPVDEARLYVRPDQPPLLLAAAITVPTARWAGTWADGMITVGGTRSHLQKMIAAFRETSGGKGRLVLQSQIAFAGSESEALEAAHDQWRVSTLSSRVLAELRMPEDFDAATQTARPEDVASKVRVSSDSRQHIEWLQEYEELGFDAVLLHNVHRDQQTFIERFGSEVLPSLHR